MKDSRAAKLNFAGDRHLRIIYCVLTMQQQHGQCRFNLSTLLVFVLFYISSFHIRCCNSATTVTAEPIAITEPFSEPTFEPTGTAEPVSSHEGTPRTENGTPEPENGTPEPGKVTPEPENGTPEPENGTPEPDTGTPEPENGTPEPENGTPEPENGTPEPENGTPEPENGTPEPENGTPEPENGTPEPENGTPEPESGTPEPENGTPEPKNGTPEPENVTPEPENGTPEPENGTPEPENGTPEPENGTPEPENGTPEPENGTPEPENGTPEPENGTPEPENGTPEPEKGTPEPEAGNSEPVAEVRPSSIEIILPPLLLCVTIVGALLVLVIARYKPCSKSYRRVWVAAFNKAKLRSVLKVRPALNTVKYDLTQKEHAPFLSTFDVEVLGSLRTFYNKPKELIRIAFPALLSLALCPITLYLYEPLVAFLWPSDKYTVFPDINDAIACFLSPAGLVYATSFGFAFQQALSKQHEVLVHVTEELSKIDQIATLTSKLRLPSLEDRLEIYRAIKAEIIFMILQIEQRECTEFQFYTHDINYKVKIWSVLDILRKIPIGERDFYMDRVMCEKIVNHITCINSICSDRMGTIHSRIHPLKWAFLETLGFFSFLGVLLLQAGGYRMELAMCVVTVFSISMLCYVVSDLDSPFSGFFRVDLSVFPDVVSRLEAMYANAILGDLSIVAYPEPQRAKVRKKKNAKKDALDMKHILATPSKASEA